MRELKFRAWDAKNKLFYYFTIGEGSGVFTVNGIYNAMCLDGIKFEQFTGLLDKNGKEIYEGDIIIKYEADCSICKDENVCNDGNCPMKESARDVVTLSRFRYWLEHESFGYEGEDLVDPTDCEIIGNIHEHA